MPIKNMVGIIIGHRNMGIFAYTEITARLTSLETWKRINERRFRKMAKRTISR